jgi:hypothetical protein
MIIVLSAALFMIIRDPASSIDAARSASAVWASTVMPALFPYMALTQLLTQSIRKYGVPEKFALPVTILLGMLGGSPSGAKLLANHYGNNSDKPRRAAQTAAAVITTASPMFMLASLPAMMRGTAAYDGLRIFAAHILANLIAGLVCYIIFSHAKDNLNEDKAQGNTAIVHMPSTFNDSFINSFFDIIKNSAISMLAVCGAMIIFGVLTSGLLSLTNRPEPAAAAIAGILEMAGGCARIASLALAAPIKAALMCAAATFGGMSIFMQNAAYLNDARADMRVQFIMKVIAGAAAFGLTLLFYMI